MGKIADRALEIAEEKFIASSGPGGQNVNKVATSVQLRVDVFQIGLPPEAFERLKDIAGSKLTKNGEIVFTANEYRTQEQNREAARERLVALKKGRAAHTALEAINLAPSLYLAVTWLVSPRHSSSGRRSEPMSFESSSLQHQHSNAFGRGHARPKYL